MFFFFNDTATTEIYTLSLHDALPILTVTGQGCSTTACGIAKQILPRSWVEESTRVHDDDTSASEDRKSTRLNSSHANISYAVFCLKKKAIPHHAQAAPPAAFTRTARR